MNQVINIGDPKESCNNLNLLKGTFQYSIQYYNAISLLIKHNNISEIIFPLVNLIHQYIENEIKCVVLEFYEEDCHYKPKDLITHDLDRLLKILLTRKSILNETEVYKNNLNNLRDAINYFYSVFDKQVFIKSRYPVDRNTNTLSFIKITFLQKEFIKTWDTIVKVFHNFKLLCIAELKIRNGMENNIIIKNYYL